jgi:hypothetical protein
MADRLPPYTRLHHWPQPDRDQVATMQRPREGQVLHARPQLWRQGIQCIPRTLLHG